MRSIEVSARTVEDAVSDGLLKLGCSISDCRVDIIKEGAKGLFGVFGSKPAVVRLTLLEEDSMGFEMQMNSMKPTAQNDRKWERPRSDTQETDESPLTAIAQPVLEKKTVERKPVPQKRALQDIPVFEGGTPPPAQRNVESKSINAGKQEFQKPQPHSNGLRQMGKKAGKPEGGDIAQNRDVLERFKSAPLPGKQNPSDVKKPRPPKKRVAAAKEEAWDSDSAKADRAFVRTNTVERVPMAPPSNIIKHGEDTPEGVTQVFLLEVTKRMGVEVQVDVKRDEEGHILATMYGDTLGILIGRRGETLDALQYLVSLQINKGQEEYIRCTLDTENYRAKREEALSKLASRMANRAIKTGRKVSLEPMNPYERRIMHSSLQGNPHVTTHSEGDEPYRHVVVVPQK